MQPDTTTARIIIGIPRGRLCPRDPAGQLDALAVRALALIERLLDQAETTTSAPPAEFQPPDEEAAYADA